MDRLRIPYGTREYVRLPLDSPDDLEAGQVEVALAPVGEEPAGSWVAGEWDPDGTNVARVLVTEVGAGSGLEVAPGTYTVWARVTLGTQRPVLEAGVVELYVPDPDVWGVDAAPTRHAAGTTATLVAYVTDAAGDLATPDSITATVTDADAVEQVTAAAPTRNPYVGVYELDVPLADDAPTGSWSVGWAITVAGGDASQTATVLVLPVGSVVHDDVREPLATVEDVAALSGRSWTEGSPGYAAAAVHLRLASGVVRRVAHQRFTRVAGLRWRTVGHTSHRVRLPEQPVERVASVAVNGHPVTDWKLSGGDLVSRAGFGGPFDTLEVVYTAGRIVPPDDVALLTATLASRMMANPTGATYVRIGTYGAGYGDDGGPLTDGERKLLDGYAPKLQR